MRSVLDVRVTFAVAVLTVHALVGCGLRSDCPVGTPQVTSAVVADKANTSTPSGGKFEAVQQPIRAQDESSAATTSTHEAPRADVAPVENPYARPPLHEPNGSNYSDIGMPYPLPSVSVVTQLPRVTPVEPAPAAPPFFETSFRPTAPSIGFPESSFRPNGEP
jgi:hypothetical protein